MAFKMKSSPMKRNFKVGGSPIKDTKDDFTEDLVHQKVQKHKDNEHVEQDTKGKKGDPEAIEVKKVTEGEEKTTTSQPSPPPVS